MPTSVRSHELLVIDASCSDNVFSSICAVRGENKYHTSHTVAVRRARDMCSDRRGVIESRVNERGLPDSWVERESETGNWLLVRVWGGE